MNTVKQKRNARENPPVFKLCMFSSRYLQTAFPTFANCETIVLKPNNVESVP